MASEELHLWLWKYTDEFGKRIQSRWRMPEEDAKRYKDAVKVEGSLEVRRTLGSTVVANRADSAYPRGRTPNWLKIKTAAGRADDRRRTEEMERSLIARFCFSP